MSPSTKKPRFNATRETVRVDWAQWDPWAGWQGLAGIAIPLFLGLAFHQIEEGAIAAGGALYIGLGSYVKQTRTSTYSMILGGLLMALCAFLGSSTGDHLIVIVVLSAFWAFAAGMLSILGPPLSFIGIKTLVSLLLAAGYPSNPREALHRGILVFAGVLLQTFLFSIEDALGRRWGAPRRTARPQPSWKNLWKGLRPHFSFFDPVFQHALRLCLSIAVAEACCRSFLAFNTYWFPLTVAIVLRPDFDQTLVRGFSRMAGTLAGVVLSTLIVLWLKPQGVTLAFLVLPSAWLCFSLFKANYALYSACITSYIVFLLTFVGLPEMAVVHNRLLATLAGGFFALAVYTLWPKMKGSR